MTAFAVESAVDNSRPLAVQRDALNFLPQRYVLVACAADQERVSRLQRLDGLADGFVGTARQRVGARLPLPARLDPGTSTSPRTPMEFLSNTSCLWFTIPCASCPDWREIGSENRCTGCLKALNGLESPHSRSHAPPRQRCSWPGTAASPTRSRRCCRSSTTSCVVSLPGICAGAQGAHAAGDRARQRGVSAADRGSGGAMAEPGALFRDGGATDAANSGGRGTCARLPETRRGRARPVLR